MWNITHPQELLSLDDDTLLQTWVELQKASKHFTELEKTARLLCSQKFFAGFPVKGSYAHITPKGKLKIVKKLNYRISSDFDVLTQYVQAVQAQADLPEEVRSKVFTPMWKFSESAYDKLPDHIKSALAPVITIGESTPTLEFVPAEES